jgi:hypothetical protein
MRFDQPVIYGTSYKGKLYIGQHVGTGVDYVGGGTIIKNIINSGKREKLITGVIEYVNDIQKLNEREIYWIKKLKPKLNLTAGGEGTLNSPRPKSKEFREAVSKKLKGRKQSKLHKERIRLALTGKKKSLEHLKKIKEHAKNRDYSGSKNPKCKNVDMLYVRYRSFLKKKWSVVLPNKKEKYFYNLNEAKTYRNEGLVA